MVIPPSRLLRWLTWADDPVAFLGPAGSRQGSHPVSCRTGRSVCRHAHAWSDDHLTSGECRIAGVARSYTYALA
jgi:hypothetical protein